MRNEGEAPLGGVRWDGASLHHRPARSPGRRSEQEHTRQDPKDGELCRSRVKPEETLVEARSGANVQIDSSDFGIGAKDSSSYLVAGSLRSFPQDSWSALAAVLSGKAND